jgi:sugar transferase (PEP-CTERM/EpsH1 system associated)
MKPHRKFNVVHVVQQLRTGGMEKMIAELARHADRTRFDLRFVCLGESGPVANEIRDAGWPVTVLNKPDGLKPKFTLELVRLFHQWRTDVVHTHNNAALLYAGPAARIADVPVLLQTRHGQAVGTSRKHRAAVRFTSLFADRIVCVSKDSQEVARKERIRDRQLLTIHNGIDTKRFAFTGPKAAAPAVMVARLVPIKGTEILLRAVHRLIADCPEFRLVVAGDGESLPACVALANELGIADRVQFLGEVRDIPKLLANASMFVLPSFSEGVSLTILEAMARGLPVVTTSVGGNPEVVEAPNTGLLVPAGNSEALASAIREVWTNPARAQAMGQAGRARVETSFDVETMTREYELLYLRLAKKAGLIRSKSKPELVAN